MSHSPTSTTPASTAANTPERILSIDALRGFDMFWIIGGRNVVLGLLALMYTTIPEEVEYHLNHPPWIGFSAWDMIMPLFLFVVGVVMPFSLGRRIAEGQSNVRLYRKILVRFVVLFVLGMVAQGNLLAFDLSKLHVFCNTLQAIACGYLVAAILLIHCSLLWQTVVTAVLLLGYGAVLMWIPVPGHEAGILEPQLNLALYIDQLLLGRFEDGTTYTWILSSLGFVGSVMLGVFAGHLLRSRQTPWRKVLWLTVFGVGCLATGWLWGQCLPIIKHLWTSSMVLWAGGWSLLLLAAFYAVIDVVGLRRWCLPLVVIGANAIAVYMATHLIDFRDISDPIVGGLANHLGPYGDALRAVAALTVIWLILWYMYRKKTFVRV